MAMLHVSQREFDLVPGVTVIGGGPDVVLRLGGWPPGTPRSAVTAVSASWLRSFFCSRRRPAGFAGKDRVDGGIYVSGSGTLVRALLADGLVDELHLFVFPLAQGAGQRLFADSGPAIKLALAGSEAYGNGALHLTYQRAA
jgi:hypothetical protein